MEGIQLNRRNIPLEESRLARKTDIFGCDADGKWAARFQGTKSAVKEYHFYCWY